MEKSLEILYPLRYIRLYKIKQWRAAPKSSLDMSKWNNQLFSTKSTQKPRKAEK